MALRGARLWQNVAAMPRGQRLGIALAGVLLAAHFGLFVWGLQRTSLPAAVSLVSLEPLAVVMTAWLLHGVRPRPLEQAGVAVWARANGEPGLRSFCWSSRSILRSASCPITYGLSAATDAGLW